jgi:hypothetical protein
MKPDFTGRPRPVEFSLPYTAKSIQRHESSVRARETEAQGTGHTEKEFQLKLCFREPLILSLEPSLSFIPQDLHVLDMELFTVPSTWTTSHGVIKTLNHER